MKKTLKQNGSGGASNKRRRPSAQAVGGPARRLQQLLGRLDATLTAIERAPDRAVAMAEVRIARRLLDMLGCELWGALDRGNDSER